jgi:hypothetical protein
LLAGKRSGDDEGELIRFVFYDVSDKRLEKMKWKMQIKSYFLLYWFLLLMGGDEAEKPRTTK